jgi:hypothetical protein
MTAALSLAAAPQAHATEIDWTKVDAALGKTASVQGEVTATASRAVTFR